LKILLNNEFRCIATTDPYEISKQCLKKIYLEDFKKITFKLDNRF
jgi:hypothetical protein